MLADDSVTAQNMGRKILADAGYEVITVNNGSAALKKIGEQRPDLIVLDVYMPGYSGLEVCQRLKEAGDTSRIPILLTVGKLEPFKPEEARRVRADGFIVKPFEASELLSALSKLEDKVVPRSESSKPGRFARATAAIEEPRYDKSVAPDEDSGWRSRIVFPKKKEKAPEQEVEDPAIYNPVNKDLRTVIDQKTEQPARPPHPETEQERVNVGALAAEGLPKDVTPEEIAALAAAAAQVKGKFAEEKPGDPVAEMAVVAPPEEKKEEPREEPRTIEPAAVAPDAPATIAPEPAVTLAETREQEKPKEFEAEAAPMPADVMAAIAGLDQPAAADGSNNGAGLQHEAASEPVTMAVAAAAGSSAAPRWTAVAVALAPEEAAISLEQEMQKAYAAFAAAETAHTATVPISEAARVEAASITPAPEAPVAAEASAAVGEVAPASAAEPVPTPIVETAAAPVEEIPATTAPEAASSLAQIASAAKDAVTAAVTELASVAASYLEKETPAESSPVVPAEPASETTAAPVAESRAPVEAKAEEPAALETPKVSDAVVDAKAVESVVVAPVELKSGEEHAEKQLEEKTEEKQIEEKKEIAEAATEVPASVATKEVPEAPASNEAVAEAKSSNSVRSTGGTDEMGKKESEISATTAAAWASWRKIRETGDSKSAQSVESAKEEASKDAAMAVAAGAESKPEDVTANLDADPEISSIVDSVLADMRPKIVEEIARKLGKKK